MQWKAVVASSSSVDHLHESSSSERLLGIWNLGEPRYGLVLAVVLYSGCDVKPAIVPCLTTP